ncbi:MAG: hypothetical protein JWM87_4510 [Candidatus Eremiobacteraeota bacterium]|nr:hypothetical protein [Candidatus Eremiobacteraeota bacterium]
MQQTNGVAVLATHLAHTDHRALSQAWYSALHLADRTPPARARPSSADISSAHDAAQRARAACGGSPDRTAAGGDHRSGARGERGAHLRGEHDASSRGERAADERGGRAAPCTATVPARHADPAADAHDSDALARHGERNAGRHRPAAGAASFTIQAAGGRVHVVVRSDGERTRVVAVCAPPLRERVERALAQVRFLLAGSGVRAEVA